MKRLILSFTIVAVAGLLAACTASPSEQSPPMAQDPDMNMSNSAL